MENTNKIVEIMNYYKISNALFIATKYNVFDYVDGEYTVIEIAKIINVDSKALEIILNMFVWVGILQKRCEEKFHINPLYKDLLSSKSSYNYLPLIKLESYLSMKHTSLEVMEKTFVTGIGIDSFNEHSKEDKQEIYGQTMDQGGKFASICVAREFSNVKSGRILDIAGGAGTYAIALCKLKKNIYVDIIDKPEMKIICEDNVCCNGLEDRIKFQSGNINIIKLQEVYDGVILSNILHLLTRVEIKKLMSKISKNLRDNGTIVFHDFFLNEDKCGPGVSSIYTLDWMMNGAFFNMSVKDLTDIAWEYGISIKKTKCYKELDTTIVVGIKV